MRFQISNFGFQILTRQGRGKFAGYHKHGAMASCAGCWAGKNQSAPANPAKGELGASVRPSNPDRVCDSGNFLTGTLQRRGHTAIKQGGSWWIAFPGRACRDFCRAFQMALNGGNPASDPAFGSAPKPETGFLRLWRYWRPARPDLRILTHKSFARALCANATRLNRCLFGTRAVVETGFLTVEGGLHA